MNFIFSSNCDNDHDKGHDEDKFHLENQSQIPICKMCLHIEAWKNSYHFGDDVFKCISPLV